MKYKAEPRGSRDWAVWANISDRIAFCKESEAKIIEFALNAVADGYELAAHDGEGVPHYYDGPAL